MPEQIITKRCSKCKTIKPTSDFYRDRRRKDGLCYWCKACNNAAAATYRQTDEGKASHEACRKRYNQTEKGKAASRRYYVQCPEKKKAKDAVNNAIKDGRLSPITSLQCSCGEQAARYHHYKGYKPEHRLDVIPVCKKCHAKIHYIPGTLKTGLP